MRAFLLFAVSLLFAPFVSAQHELALPAPGALSADRAGGGAEVVTRIAPRAPRLLPIEGFPFLTPPSHAAPAPAEPVAAPSTPAARKAKAPGAVRSRVETVYYDVQGADRSDLMRALRRHGPTVSGRRFFGMTEWEMGASFLPRATECSAADVTVQVTVTTHLPRWTGEDASADLRAAWDRFRTALDAHEEGHRALAHEAADAVRTRLADVTVERCDDLVPAVQQAMQRVMHEYETQHLAYDAETGHGRTQGAVWPQR